MSDVLTSINNSLISHNFYTIVRAFFIVVAGYVIARIASHAVERTLNKYVSLHQNMLIRKLIFYVILALFIIAALQEFDFKLSVLLGTAGIFTLALGFAAQMSVSNLISGIFLIFEKPFVIGDLISVSGMTGEVYSIDLLAIQIRTLDNTLIRIPSETLIKSPMINYSRFPKRRFDLQIIIAYEHDLETVKNILFEVAKKNSLCLSEPKPEIFFQSFGENGVNLQFSVWATKDNFVALKNSIQEQVKKAFEEHQIEIPLKHTLFASSKNEPIQIKIIADEHKN